MAYQVIALRYRPRRFMEVVGQEETAQTLKMAVENGRLAHAYLFSGPRGVGKTSMARILAMALNCQARQDGEPCGDCASCRDISAGVDMDVIELDGASNRGIDDVRELISSAICAPLRGTFKVYIVDEVHMLTREAFNAFLKTLEEPPAHVRFVLATTEPQRIPETVVSRLQRFDFRPIGEADVVRRLGQICDAEGVTLSEDVLSRIAQYAHGGMRDAQTLLDQLITFAGNAPTLEDLERVAGRLDSERLGRLIEAIHQRDVQRIWQLVREALAGVTSPEGLLEQLILAFRDTMQASIQRDGKVDETLLLRIEILTGTVGRLHQSPFPEIVVETCLLRLADCEGLVNIATLLEETDRPDAAAPTSKRPVRAGPTGAAPSAPQPAPAAGTAQAPPRSSPAAPAAPAPPEPPPPPPQQPGPPSAAPPQQRAAPSPPQPRPETRRPEAAPAKPRQDALRVVQELWQSIIDETKRKSVRAGEFLRLAKPVSAQGGTVTLAVSGPTSFSFLKQTDTKKLLTRIINQVTSLTLEVSVQLQQKEKPAAGSAGERNLAEEPLFKKAREIFGEP